MPENSCISGMLGIPEEAEHIVKSKCLVFFFFNTRNEIVYLGENNVENLLEGCGSEF